MGIVKPWQNRLTVAVDNPELTASEFFQVVRVPNIEHLAIMDRYQRSSWTGSIEGNNVGIDQDEV